MQTVDHPSPVLIQTCRMLRVLLRVLFLSTLGFTGIPTNYLGPDVCNYVITCLICVKFFSYVDTFIVVLVLFVLLVMEPSGGGGLEERWVIGVFHWH